MTALTIDCACITRAEQPIITLRTWNPSNFGVAFIDKAGITSMGLVLIYAFTEFTAQRFLAHVMLRARFVDILRSCHNYVVHAFFKGAFSLLQFNILRHALLVLASECHALSGSIAADVSANASSFRVTFSVEAFISHAISLLRCIILRPVPTNAFRKFTHILPTCSVALFIIGRFWNLNDDTTTMVTIHSEAYIRIGFIPLAGINSSWRLRFIKAIHAAVQWAVWSRYTFYLMNSAYQQLALLYCALAVAFIQALQSPFFSAQFIALFNLIVSATFFRLRITTENLAILIRGLITAIFRGLIKRNIPSRCVITFILHA
jgi:hypothetical protein